MSDNDHNRPEGEEPHEGFDAEPVHEEPHAEEPVYEEPVAEEPEYEAEPAYEPEPVSAPEVSFATAAPAAIKRPVEDASEAPRRGRKGKKPKKEKKQRSLGFRIFVGMIRVFLFVGILSGIGVTGYAALFVYHQLPYVPDPAELLEYQPRVMTRIHAGDGSLIAEYANERRLFVPIEQIPDHVINAFVAAEDQNFYSHPGIDIQGLARAAIATGMHYITGRGGVEGASTITMQVAKNFLLSSEQTYERKVREMLVALRIEQAMSKDEILELYLNEIYLGWRSYGVAAAALNYFRKPLEELTIAEAAYLAVLPKGPENYRPDQEASRARSLERRNYVIRRMLEDGYITREQADDAMAEELVVYDRPEGAQAEAAEYFAEEVRRDIADEFGYDALLDGGLSVRTTVDMEIQRYARDALRNGLVAYDQRHGWRGPIAHLEDMADWRRQIREMALPRDLAPWQVAVVTNVNDALGQAGISLAGEEGATGIIPLSQMDWAREQASNRIDVGGSVRAPSQVLAVGDVIWVEEVGTGDADATEDGGNITVVDTAPARVFALRQLPAVNGAVIAMDPHTGRVLAMVGGFSFDASEFNRATQAWRQPGSSFKPFVYAAALDQGRTPSDLILDAPFVMPQGEGLPLWRPDNYTDRFYGPSTLRSGVERSRNAMTVRLAQDIGMEHVVDIAERFGVVDHLDPYLAYALGAGETTLLRMVTAYSQFVNGGRRVHPTMIDRVQDRYGVTLTRSDLRECVGCQAEEYTGQPEPVLPDTREEILDPRTAYQVVSILEGVVQRGTGRSLRSVGVPLGGKTGTTNDERDAWFMGISPDLVVGAYVGFDQPYPMGRAETGGRVAAPIVREIFTETVGTRPPIPFRRPPGIRIVRVNAETGQLAQPGDLNVIEEAFRPGTEPTGEVSVIGGDNGLRTDEEDDLRSGSGGLY